MKPKAKPKPVVAWAVVGDGLTVNVYPTKAAALTSSWMNMMPVQGRYRVVKLVEHDPSLIALAKAAVASRTKPSNATWIALGKAVERYRGRR